MDSLFHNNHNPSSSPNTKLPRPKLLKTKTFINISSTRTPSPSPSTSSSYSSSSSSDDYHSDHRVEALSKYEVLDELGIGATSFVLLARYRDNTDKREDLVAIKVLYKEMAGLNGWMRDPELRRILPMEIFLLRKLRHDNVIQFIEFLEDSRYFYLVTELHGSPWSKYAKKLHKQPLEMDLIPRPDSAIDLMRAGKKNNIESIGHPSKNDNKVNETKIPETMPLGKVNLNITSTPKENKRISRDLFECLEQNSFLSEKQVWTIFTQVTSSIQYLHFNGIVHRDIKDENILIDENLVVKLCDFGSAHPISRGTSQWITTSHGTIHYQSPEIMKQIPHDGKSSDIWALGVLLYILAFGGKVPFADSWSACEGRYLPPRYKRSSNLINLLNELLQPDHLRRINIEAVMAHPWIHGCFTN